MGDLEKRLQVHAVGAHGALEDDLIDAITRLRELEAALRELVMLKDMKDAHGATVEYRARKATAWNRARASLGQGGEG